MNDPVLSDGLLIFGFLVIVLAPMSLALAYTGPGGAGWKLLTAWPWQPFAWSLSQPWLPYAPYRAWLSFAVSLAFVLLMPSYVWP